MDSRSGRGRVGRMPPRGRSAPRRSTAGTPMPGTLRGLAIGLAAALPGVRSRTILARGGARPLWIAAVQTSGALIPFARHGDDGWDLPWPAPFDAETGALSGGGEAVATPRPDREAPSLPMPPVDQDSRGGRIAAPMQWEVLLADRAGLGPHGGEADAGRSPLHDELGTGFRRARAAPSVEGTRDVAGVAFNHPLEVVPAEEEIPGSTGYAPIWDLVDVDDPRRPGPVETAPLAGLLSAGRRRHHRRRERSAYEGESWRAWRSTATRVASPTASSAAAADTPSRRPLEPREPGEPLRGPSLWITAAHPDRIGDPGGRAARPAIARGPYNAAWACPTSWRDACVRSPRATRTCVRSTCSAPGRRNRATGFRSRRRNPLRVAAAAREDSSGSKSRCIRPPASPWT